MDEANTSAASRRVLGGADGATRRPDLWVAWVRLSAFRNYATATLACSPGPMVLTGPNGAGKTNLLEAVSFLAPGRGLRRARLGDIARAAPEDTVASAAMPETAMPGMAATAPAATDAAAGPETAWAVAAEVMTPWGARRIGTGREAGAGARERRVVRIDETPAPGQQALGDVVAATWLTPAMDRLFVEAPSGRRRFLDRLVQGLDPTHAGRAASYEHALRERARLLRHGAPADPAWLAALEQRMAATGVAIAAARRDLVQRLNRTMARAVGPFPRAGVDLGGDVETWLATASALDAEERMQADLAAARARDAETGGAGVGPHRCDVWVRHIAKAVPAAQCSTGEQKALLIAIILAHARLLSAERGFAPLVLLDEVAAHLDAERRAALFAALLDLGVQAWLTGTDPGLFAPLRGQAQFTEIRDACIAAPPSTQGPER